MNLVEITQELLDSPILNGLLNDVPLQFIRYEESIGGIYRAIVCEAEVVGMAFISSDKDCSIAVHRNYQQKGLATAALKKLMKIAFDDNGFDKVTAQTQIGRPSSKLVSKLNLKETSRTNDEIFYEYTNEMWEASKA